MATDNLNYSSYELVKDSQEIVRKRAARKGHVKRLETYFEPILETPFEHLERDKVVDKQKEQSRQLGHLHALQSRYQTLIAISSPEEVVEEIAAGEKLQEDYATLTEKVEGFLNCFHWFQEGLDLAEDLASLKGQENLSTRTNREFFEKLSSRHSTFRKKTRIHASDPEIERVRNETERLKSEIVALIAKDSMSVDESSRGRRSSSRDSEERSTPTPHSRLPVELPTFSGKPQDWASFNSLFLSVMKSAGAGLPNRDRCSHLIKAMQTEEACQTARVAVGDDSNFDRAIAELEEAFGRPNMVYPTYILPLLQLPTFTYDYSSSVPSPTQLFPC